MHCPIDKIDLVMADRNGIEIDYCPKCRGVWLDRGELDKLVERAASPSTMRPPVYRSEREYRHDHDGRPYHKKRKSFLNDIFDF